MADHDLNLENYDLDDLLELFGLDYNFNEKDLKKARFICYKTHPDKSKLPKEYFQFYLKAYKMIDKVYYYRQRRKNMTTEYITDEVEADKKILETIQKNKEDFNKWFNDAFNKVKIKDDIQDTGYEEWFRSKDDNVQRNKVGLADFDKAFYNEKQNCKALIKRKGIEEMGGCGGYDLVRERPQEYSSDIFSKLSFEDLKKAHTETVIPVTRDDFDRVPKFADLDSYRKHREGTDTEPMSMSEARHYMSSKAAKEGKENVKNAFKILKQDEEIEKSHQEWWSYIKQIDNG